jgi:murein DD-endopeptidase MepM/ murein hydrolase activator NlpD
LRKPPTARRSYRLIAAAAVALVAALAGAAQASAGGGAASAGGGGGIGAPAPPRPRDVTCASTCAGLRKAVAGSSVVISGDSLGAVSSVRFTAASGPRIAVAPTKVSAHAVEVTVPRGAASGKPAVFDSFGNKAVSPTSLRIVKHVPATSGFKLTAATAAPRKAYYYGVSRPRVSYVFSGVEPLDVRVSVVSAATGAVVDSFLDTAAEPNTANSARWNGLTSAGTEAPSGKYRFAIVPAGGGTPASTANSTFSYYGFKFPVRGPHTYGDGVGAPRKGHVHEGQDVMAACGTPIVAARGGRIQRNARQAAAGNYVVIDGKGTRRDYMYAHLAQRSPLQQGQRVHTGQRIGVVGQTGDATACHLHFEEWSGPGWYQGGHYMRRVTRDLKRWDSWS